MKQFLILITLVVVFAGCGNNSGEGSEEKLRASQLKNLESELYDSVIAVHDIVMPRMDELNMAIARLENQLEESGSQDSLQLITKINKLKAADSAMMAWMRAFEPIDENDTHEEIMQTLNNELQRINKVNEMVEEATSLISE